jgi:hypothetical protein
MTVWRTAGKARAQASRAASEVAVTTDVRRALKGARFANSIFPAKLRFSINP